jgi:hypothetical protein
VKALGAAAFAACTLAAPALAADEGGSLYGAAGPELGQFVLYGSLGVALILPHVTAGVRAGLGGGVGVEGAYRNLAAFGQEGRFRLLWGTEIAPSISLGLAYKTSYATLELADGGLIGIQFSALPLGNDWTMGNELTLTIERPGAAHLSFALGPNFTLGGTRYTGFEQKELQWDPAPRSIDAAVQGEWQLWADTNLLLRLDAMFLLGQETDEACEEAHQDNCSQLVPFGFIPTGTLGLLWSP